jgi:hypothetical protein
MDSPISIRVASDGEERPFPQLTGPVLLAEQDGSAVAAVDIVSGEVAADPGRSSPGLFALLHLHRLEARLVAVLVGG